MKAAARAQTFRFREYRPQDLPELCSLDRLCFPEKVAYPLETMRETIEEKETFTVVAEDEQGAIAGFVVAGRTSPRIGHIATLDVSPRCRREGLGTRLMRAAEARLLDLGVRKMRLETATGNPARRLFEKLGYERVGKIERYYPDGSDAWVMEKQVPGKQGMRSSP